jgi:hypothetical protein
MEHRLASHNGKVKKGSKTDADHRVLPWPSLTFLQWEDQEWGFSHIL